MLNNIQIFRYIDTNSIIQKINPLNKLLTLIIFTIISITSNNIIEHILLIIYLLFLILLSKIKINKYLKSMKCLLYLLIPIFIVNLLCKIDLILNITNIFKIIEIYIYSSLITISTSTNELIYSLDKLLLPLKILKINTKKIILVLTLSIKFIPIVIEEFNKVIKGLISKGIKKNKILVLKAIIIPTFSLLISKADMLADELELKLYDYNIKIDDYNWNLKDWIILMIYIIVFGGRYALLNDIFLWWNEL